MSIGDRSKEISLLLLGLCFLLNGLFAPVVYRPCRLHHFAPADGKAFSLILRTVFQITNDERVVTVSDFLAAGSFSGKRPTDRRALSVAGKPANEN